MSSQAPGVESCDEHVFRIDTTDRSYALKIYGVGRFSLDEIRWEQQLTHELAGAGVPVAVDVRLRSGDSVGALDAPEGERAFALTEWFPAISHRGPGATPFTERSEQASAGSTPHPMLSSADTNDAPYEAARNLNK